MTLCKRFNVRIYSRIVNISELSFQVLTVLAEKPRHGYDILQEVKTLTNDKPQPAVATLYRTLDRLVDQQLIEEAEREIVDGRFRRTYRLTEEGLAALAQEASHRQATAKIANERVRLHPLFGSLSSVGLSQ